MKTQKEQVAEWLLNNGSITAFSAIYQLGITQVATRIFELEQEDGIVLNHVKRLGTAKNGRTFHFTEYVLPEEARKKVEAWLK